MKLSFANGSITDVRMWMIRNTPTSSERLRCNDWTTNRGQSRRVSREEVSTPSTTLALSSRSAVYPLACVAYHIGVGPARAASNGRARSGSAGYRYRCPAICVLRLLDRRAETGLRGAAIVGGPGLCRWRRGHRVSRQAGGSHQGEHAGERGGSHSGVDGQPSRAGKAVVSPNAGVIQLGWSRHAEQTTRATLAER